MDLDSIRRHWERVGERLELDDRVTGTSRDPYLGEREEAEIAARLRPGDRVLEVGCGDAAHTLRYAGEVREIHGLDVATSLIEKARLRAQAAGVRNAHFRAGSVLELDRIFPDERFDAVVSQRCLINLPGWEHQSAALDAILRVLRPGGRLLLSEGFEDELQNLNRVREELGLDPIRTVDYNRNLRHAEFDPFVERHFRIESVEDYGGYLFLSRVLHPLAVAPDPPRHDSPLNAAAAAVTPYLPRGCLRRYSYNLCYVLEKK